MAEYKGVGAWRVPKEYSNGMIMPENPYQRQRVKWATIAFQRELVRRGYLTEPAKWDGWFGLNTQAAVKKFQKDCGLNADGKIGPKTATRLFLPYFIFWEVFFGIPNHLLAGMIRLESACDPGAEGMVDPGDRGVGQFNRKWHPDITDEIAFSDPATCIMKTAVMLDAAYKSLGNWDAAVANHNSPKLARQWASTGLPPNPTIARYVELVKVSANKSY